MTIGADYTLAVIDRQFKGEIASTMDKLTTRALQAQVEAAVSFILYDINIPFIYMLQNVDRENSNKVKQEEGALAVARIKAQSHNVSPDFFYKLFIIKIFLIDTSRFRGIWRHCRCQSPG